MDGIFELRKAILPRAILSFLVPQRSSHRHSSRKLVHQSHRDDLQKSTPKHYQKELPKHERNKTTIISSIQSTLKKHVGRMQQQFEIEKTENATNTTQKNVPDVIGDKVLEKIFEKRSAIRKRACDNLHLIYGLMQSKTATFEDLLR